MSNLDYLTREFVRNDCGTNGAFLSDRDCDLIIAEVKRLDALGEFYHTGVYWIANRLAGEGVINPIVEDYFTTGPYGYISDDQIIKEYRNKENK